MPVCHHALVELRGMTEATAVNLVPVGYQSPAVFEMVGDGSDDPDDTVDDWLMISCQATDPRGDWGFVDACLTVAEGAELSAWLHRAANGDVAVSPPGPAGEVVPSMYFTEPNLSFSVADRDASTLTIRVHFDYESAPPWATGPLASQQNWLNVTATPADVHDAAGRWAIDLAPYPPRVWTEPVL